MVDGRKKGSEAVQQRRQQQQQQQLTLLGIKKNGPTFSGSGSFAYSHLHTPIKKSSYLVHHAEVLRKTGKNK